MKKLFIVLACVLEFCVSAWAAVDLNTATQAELETVSGIGPTKAKAIVEYRNKHGKFKSADELEKVPGFGKKSVGKLKKDISVGNATAAAAGKADKSAKEAKAATTKEISVGSPTAAGAGKTEKSVKAAKDTAKPKKN